MKPQFNRNNLILAVLSLTLVFGMFNAADAQRNPPKSKPQSTSAEILPARLAPDISYTVSMSKPWTHLLEVEMRLRYQDGPGKADIVMPVWTPGSYLIREYERHVLDFAAENQHGDKLIWEKINKNTWRIDSGGTPEILITYKVYANELTVRTNELNDEHAFWNNAATLMFPKDNLKASSTLRVIPFQNWKIATSLPTVEGQTNTFRAENFDVLYDSPFEVGNFTEINFDVRGVPHRMIFEGEGNYNLERLRQDVPKIVETAAAIFGELPYKNYLFIVNLRGGGGLEHLNSTALQFNRFGFSAQRYVGFLGLVAHEFFHAWNVKRIRPDALGPFDYERENYTKLLWVAEGGTEFYSNVILRRAGFISDKEYLQERAAGINALQNRPGRFQQSVEESSFDAWIKYYRPDENSINREISYYDKGEIVNMLLDLTIRQKTMGAKSLDDVMRTLYNDFYKKGRNYTPADFQKICETVAGTSLDDFFRKTVRGHDEIDYNSVFAGFGIKLETAVPNQPNAAFLGADFRPQGDFLSVAQLPAGSPAYEGGLNTGDLILAIDGFKIANQNDLNARLADRKPGDKIKMTVFRFDRLREIEIALGGRAAEQYRFTVLPSTSEIQKQFYQGWLGAELK
ncbi:MAG: PDZ domain-containing protein [Pyrinomonadaceae bacterium]